MLCRGLRMAPSQSQRDGPCQPRPTAWESGCKRHSESPNGAARGFVRSATFRRGAVAIAVAFVHGTTTGPPAFGPPLWGSARFIVPPAPGRWPGLASGCHVVAEDGLQPLAWMVHPGAPPGLRRCRSTSVPRSCYHQRYARSTDDKAGTRMTGDQTARGGPQKQEFSRGRPDGKPR